MSRLYRPVMFGFLALAVFSPQPVGAQERKPPSPDVPAEKFFKNIRVFKGLPSTELMGAMQFMASSLEVGCDHCHVTSESGHWPMEKDDKEAKRVARKMVLMMREINRANFEGRTEVNCATCHHGHQKPSRMPPLLEAAAAHPPAAEKAAGLPFTKEVLSRYAEAIGGREAFAKIRNRVLKGTVTTADGQSYPLEIDQAAPNKYRSVVTLPRGTSERGYDGRAGWNASGGRVGRPEASELAELERRAVFSGNVDLAAQFSALAVAGEEPAEGGPAWMLMGRARDGTRTKLLFDEKSGLLVRRVEYQDTVLGSIPDQTDFSDYEEVDGVRLPFTVLRTGPRFRQVQKYDEIRQNVELDPAIFEPPAPGAGTGGS
jgi:hypothetical protein